MKTRNWWTVFLLGMAIGGAVVEGIEIVKQPRQQQTTEARP